MAKNKVYIDIEINGNLQKVAVDAKKLSQALGETSTNAHSADRAMKGAGQASSNSTKNFSKMAQGITGGLVPAYAELAANVFAITAAFQFLKNAADLRVLQDSQVAYASATGAGMQSLVKDIQNASDAMLGFRDASEAAAIGVASGLQTSQITQLAEGAANVSKILGRDVTDSFNRLVRGVTKAEPELLDELGITLRLEDAKRKYATQLGKTAKQLSLYEQKQAVFNEVQGQLEQKMNRIARIANVQGNAMQKLQVAFDKVLKPIKEVVASIAEFAAGFLTENIRSLAAALSLLSIPIFNRIVGGMDNISKASQESAAKAKEAYATASAELEKLQKSQKTVSLTGALQSAGTKSIGLENLRKGIDLTEKQVNSLLAAAKKGVGAVKTMSKEQAAVYIRELERMKAGKSRFTRFVLRQWDMIGGKAQVVAAKMRASWASATAAMSKATAAFANAANKAVRAIGIVGVALMLLDVAKQVAGIFLKANPMLERFAENVNDLRDKLETNNKEFKNFVALQKELMTDLDGNEFGKATLDSMKAMGKMLETVTPNVISLQKALKAGPIVSGGMSGISAQMELANLEQQMITQKAIMLKNGEGAGEAAKKYYNLKTSFIETAKAAGKSSSEVETSFSRIFVAAENMKNAMDGGTWVDAALGTKADMEGAKAQAAEAAKRIIEGLYATKVAAQEGGKEFIQLNTIIAEGGILTEEQLSRYEQLSQKFISTGGAAAAIAEGMLATRQEFDAFEASRTTYVSSVTSMINANSQLLEDLKAQEDYYGKPAAVAELEARLEKLQRIHMLEVEIARQKVAAQSGFEASTIGIGGVRREEEEKELALKMAKIEILKKETELEDALNAKKQDPGKIAILREELSLMQTRGNVAARNLNEVTKLHDGLVNSFENGLSTAIEGLITGTMTLKSAFKNLAVSVLQDLARMLTRMLVLRMMMGIFGGPITSPAMAAGQVSGTGQAGGLVGPVNALQGAGLDAGGFPVLKGATGGVMSGPRKGFPAILHGTEAVVPLPNGRELPVEMRGNSGNTNNVTVNVSIAGDGSASSQQDGGQGAGNLGKAIASAVQQELQNQKRSGGILNPYGVA